jgi:hypothetical protein
MPSPLSVSFNRQYCLLHHSLLDPDCFSYWEAVTHNAKAGNFQFDEGAERMYKTALLTDDSIHAVSRT